ncbi:MULTISPECIES: hypothetical protein [unclassified Thiocapsa]|uniref:hypothetical protein n=1 Tax=unclassified Thiocapsa TaxID=2641286 RepID=UPI0035B2EF88
MNHHPYQTQHAECRAQQRCIPPLMHEWLERFGEEIYDGHGVVIRYFDKRSRRRMERDLGREPVKRFADKLRAYRVEDSRTGVTLTTGYRTRRLPR